MFFQSKAHGNRKFISKLENAILCHSNEKYELEMEYITQMDEELPNEMGDGLTYRKKSPFGQHFDSILKSATAMLHI